MMKKMILVLSISLLTASCASTGKSGKNQNYVFDTTRENFIALAERVKKVGKKDVYNCPNINKFYVTQLDKHSLALRPWHDDINPKYLLFKHSSGKTFRSDSIDGMKTLLSFDQAKKMKLTVTEKSETKTELCDFVETSPIEDSSYW